MGRTALSAETFRSLGNLKGVGIALLPLAFLLTACGSVTATETATATPDLVAQGREVYMQVCAECHAERGQGYADHPSAPPLDDSGHAWHHPDQQIYGWIVNGKLGVAGGGMPALGDRLTDEEVQAVIAYLHSLWTEEQLETQQDVTTRYPTTPTPSPTP